MKHREIHPTDVPGCFACHLANVQFAKPSFSSLNTTLTERRWEKDMPAYKRLRQNGLQPKGIDGSAQLETRANDRLEVEMGHLLNKGELARAREGMAMAREMNDA
jgi:hypothetical protein